MCEISSDYLVSLDHIATGGFLQTICIHKPQKHLSLLRKDRRRLLHEQHLSRAFDCLTQSALVMRGQSGVFARQQAALVSNKLLKKIDVLEIQGVDSEIDLGFGALRSQL
jgi:hypothetical protein